MKYDVIIVGAGPAGATTARICARRGLKVALVEKEALPRYKPCGGGVSQKALQLIPQVPSQLVEQNVYAFRFVAPTLDSVEFRSDSLIGVTTFRDKFDKFLVDQAVAAGCDVINATVISVKPYQDSISCVLDDQTSHAGKLVVGADGANGVVARSVGIRAGWNRNEIGICFEGELEVSRRDLETRVKPDTLELHFMRIPFGYGWVFPRRKSLAVGIGGLAEAFSQPYRAFQRFTAKIRHTLNIPTNITNIHGHIIPAGGIRRKIVTHRVILVGDAAGFVDPLTGEGIYYAMKSGQLAAKTCLQAFEKKRFDSRFLQRYSSACYRSFGKDLGLAFRLAHLVHGNLDFFFAILKQLSDSGESIRILSAEESSYRKLICRTILHLPAALPSLIKAIVKNVL
ncbi:MAG: geranylgeranyl reductase family protein [Promethearchaeota archaeon]